MGLHWRHGAILPHKLYLSPSHIVPRQVLAGWLHAVSNRQACIKVAWEFMEADRALYPAVSKLIATHIGERAAKDYMLIYTCAFNSAMQH